MNRCVVIHSNATTEVQDVQPTVHQRLRGLGYKRFAVEYVRDGDRHLFKSAIYSKMTPSSWQVGEAVKQLWGRRPGTIRLFDENGELVGDRSGSGTVTQAAERIEPVLGSEGSAKALPEVVNATTRGFPLAGRDGTGSALSVFAEHGEVEFHAKERLDGLRIGMPAIPQLIAVLNAALPDADTRKITRDKVQCLRALVDGMRVHERTDGIHMSRDESEALAIVEALAEALESYLPQDGKPIT
jgi:hypothetical protein